MNGAPERAGEAPHGERRELDGEKSPRGDDAEGDGAGLPFGGVRDGEVGEAEVGVVVGDEGGEVGADEGDGEPAEPAVQVEQPGGAAPAAERVRRQDDSPDHRGGEHQPGDDARGAGDVPPQLRVHDRHAWSTGTATWRSSVVITAPSRVDGDAGQSVGVEVVDDVAAAGEDGGGGVGLGEPAAAGDDGDGVEVGGRLGAGARGR